MAWRVLAVSAWVSFGFVSPTEAQTNQHELSGQEDSGHEGSGQEQTQDAVASHLDTAARALFLAGREAFDAGRYADALVSFERAHELSDRPELLFNIAHTLDRLRRDEEAIGAFEAYLETDPPESQRAQVEARLGILRAQVARAASPPLVEAPRSTTPAPRETPNRRARILGALAAVVLVGAVTGLALGLRDRTPDYRAGDSGDVHLALVRW